MKLTLPECRRLMELIRLGQMAELDRSCHRDYYREELDEKIIAKLKAVLKNDPDHNGNGN